MEKNKTFHFENRDHCLSPAKRQQSNQSYKAYYILVNWGAKNEEYSVRVHLFSFSFRFLHKNPGKKK